MNLKPGHTRTLGARLEAGGVNFCLAAPNAVAVEVCVFATVLGEEKRYRMHGSHEGLWHGFLPEAGEGLLYGYRVYGPWNPTLGQRFNPAKLLLDPAALEVVGRYDGDDIHLGHQASNPAERDERDNAVTAMKAKVVGLQTQVGHRVSVAPSSRVIYELHVKGYTALHADVPENLRGTYAGLSHPAAISHLRTLGVTTLSIMPVAHRADEVRLQRMGLVNYWGYSPIAWSAPESRYWSGLAGTSPRGEFRAMVDALHAAGIEVILDVVYNHTGETDEFGPTLSLRGIDNATYYHLDPSNPALYMNWTGCGNCVNLTHPLVLRTVMDSLRSWVEDLGVDGFRFDLAPVLARAGVDRQFSFDANAPLLMAIAQDPVLRDCTMVAEPWDIGPGGYQLGAFPAGWLEWNDRFRDTQRGYWLQQQGTRGSYANRLAGSADAFVPSRRPSHSSVNFVTAHDGFTLADLVSYAHRHNEANGEGNRDGHGHNMSVNNGVEGPSTDGQVLAARARQKRVLLANVLFSLGTPMLLAGDEIGHSQQGNNNAYCQDNSTTWLDWASADVELAHYVAAIIALRQELPVLQAKGWWRAAQDTAGHVPVGPVAEWFSTRGIAMRPSQWNHAHEHALLLVLTSTDSAAVQCMLVSNPSADLVDFVLPQSAPGFAPWKQRLDTYTGDVRTHAMDSVLTLRPQSLVLATSAPL